MRNLFSHLACCILLFACMHSEPIHAFGSGSLPGSTPSTIPPVTQPKPAAPPSVPYVPHPKTTLPPMQKPFGMPGVVGFHDGKWDGTDYLGHLSKNISVSIEILKGENSSINIDTNALEATVNELLRNGGIIPKADVVEGPPVPFLHILIIIYPIEKDSYTVFTTCRLFESIDVLRKNFKPAGYWQGITWENQDIFLSSGEQLATQIKASVDRLIKAFLDRYHLYNDSLENNNKK